MTKHTPGPWSHIFMGAHNYDIDAPSQPLGKMSIAQGIRNEANAEFIVKACNLHYDLLEACKEALQSRNMQVSWATFEKLRQAIIKAEAT